MKALVVVLALGASGALWYWALAWPKPIEPLDAKYVGTYELYRYEAPEGRTGDDPIERNQRWIYRIEADHLYTLRILVERDLEMAQRAGVVTEEVTPEGDEFLVFTQHTLNAVAASAVPDRNLVEWGSDEQGPYLVLTGEMNGRRGPRLFLRRIEK